MTQTHAPRGLARRARQIRRGSLQARAPRMCRYHHEQRVGQVAEVTDIAWPVGTALVVPETKEVKPWDACGISEHMWREGQCRLVADLTDPTTGDGSGHGW